MRTLLLFIAFFNTEIIERSLESFAREKKAWNSFDLVVLENPSPNSSEIRRVVSKYLRQGVVLAHLRWEKNVAANVVTRAVLEGHLAAVTPLALHEYEYIGVTEGDVVVEPGLLQEMQTLLGDHPELEHVAADVDLSNLPLNNFPEAREWVPAPLDRGDYLEGETGLQLVLARTSAFFAFIGALARGELREKTVLTWRECPTFSDRNWRQFAQQRGKPWARTKKRRLLHIGWELYSDLDNDYVRHKDALVKSGSFWQDEGGKLSVKRLPA